MGQKPSKVRRLNDLSKEELRDLQKDLQHFYCKHLPELVRTVRQYTTELDKIYRDVKISRVAGTTTSIVGGVLGVVGFGLSFTTFGASLILSVVGGVIGGAGAITVGGATIAEGVKCRKTKAKAEEKFRECENECQRLIEKFKDITLRLEEAGILVDFIEWIEFWWKIIGGSLKATKGFGKDLIYNTVSTSLTLAKGVDAAGDATAFFRTLGSVGKGFHIFGGVFGAIMLPFDILALKKDLKSIHKKEAHSLSKRLRATVDNLEKECLKVQRKVIEQMIEATIARLN